MSVNGDEVVVMRDTGGDGLEGQVGEECYSVMLRGGEGW